MTDPYFQDRQVLHVAPICYTIDGANGIENPIDMYGSRYRFYCFYNWS